MLLSYLNKLPTSFFVIFSSFISFLFLFYHMKIFDSDLYIFIENFYSIFNNHAILYKDIYEPNFPFIYGLYYFPYLLSKLDIFDFFDLFLFEVLLLTFFSFYLIYLIQNRNKFVFLIIPFLLILFFGCYGQREYFIFISFLPYIFLRIEQYINNRHFSLYFEILILVFLFFGLIIKPFYFAVYGVLELFFFLSYHKNIKIFIFNFLISTFYLSLMVIIVYFFFPSFFDNLLFMKSYASLPSLKGWISLFDLNSLKIFIDTFTLFIVVLFFIGYFLYRFTNKIIFFSFILFILIFLFQSKFFYYHWNLLFSFSIFFFFFINKIIPHEIILIFIFNFILFLSSFAISSNNIEYNNFNKLLEFQLPKKTFIFSPMKGKIQFVLKEKRLDFISANSMVFFSLRKNINKKFDFNTEISMIKYIFILFSNDLNNHKDYFIFIENDMYNFYKDNLFKKYKIFKKYKNSDFLLLKRY